MGGGYIHRRKLRSFSCYDRAIHRNTERKRKKGCCQAPLWNSHIFPITHQCPYIRRQSIALYRIYIERGGKKDKRIAIGKDLRNLFLRSIFLLPKIYHQKYYQHQIPDFKNIFIGTKIDVYRRIGKSPKPGNSLEDISKSEPGREAYKYAKIRGEKSAN